VSFVFCDTDRFLGLRRSHAPSIHETKPGPTLAFASLFRRYLFLRVFLVVVLLELVVVDQGLFANSTRRFE